MVIVCCGFSVVSLFVMMFTVPKKHPHMGDNEYHDKYQPGP